MEGAHLLWRILRFNDNPVNWSLCAGLLLSAEKEIYIHIATIVRSLNSKNVSAYTHFYQPLHLIGELKFLGYFSFIRPVRCSYDMSALDFFESTGKMYEFPIEPLSSQRHVETCIFVTVYNWLRVHNIHNAVLHFLARFNKSGVDSIFYERELVSQTYWIESKYLSVEMKWVSIVLFIRLVLTEIPINLPPKETFAFVDHLARAPRSETGDTSRSKRARDADGIKRRVDVRDQSSTSSFTDPTFSHHVRRKDRRRR